MSNILIVGGTRGLGAALALRYIQRNATVFATARSEPKDKLSDKIVWIPNVDIATESAGSKVVKGLNGQVLSTVIVSAGYFGKESFDEPSWDGQVAMYKTSSIGPLFLVHHLVKNNLLAKHSKVILVSSESGSITLRHESEGGGNYGHHASKTALNMVGKLLSLDLKDKGIAVGMVHPGFMRTEMTRAVGFDKFWDAGGAVTPDESAESLIPFIDSFDMSKTGTYWAPRGAADIGTAEDALGKSKKDLPVPLQLPCRLKTHQERRELIMEERRQWLHASARKDTNHHNFLHGTNS